ncbi:MAG TPA: circadian clock protein KaiC [Thermoanaerobaculia bacterium]|nr:circadian clock protein KaiC [Thermoanaerobaculia bacterium]
MSRSAAETREAPAGSALVKAPTGIQGLDEVTGGGLPAGRPTLICGSAGCGKTLVALEFLVHGAVEFGEPGVFFAFEERPEELAQNVRSLGFDLEDLERRNLLVVDYVQIERSEIEETGEYDLEGLFLRLGFAIDSIGAKRVGLDTLETLFGNLGNEAILRAELRRLFRWLKDRGVTAVITAERGDGALTRYGLEEYVSDCVILLDNRVIDQVATRRLRIVKYRGSAHGTNEYPFLIDEGGLEVLPITAAGLQHSVSQERVSSGVPQLDAMLGGGYYRGSSVLVSGTAGSGKSSLAVHFAAAACRRGERVVYFAFEESRDQVVRNMSSIGIDLATPVAEGKLFFHASRPTLYGLEGHLALMHKKVREADPRVVIIDPIGTFLSVSNAMDVKSLLVRLMDFLKERQITTLFTSLTTPGASLEQTDVGISSLIDTWLLLRDFETGGERNRGLHILKSRGMRHSNQVREFLLTDHGIELVDVYLGPEGVLTGSARRYQEAREQSDSLVREQEIERRRRELDLKRQALEARVATLRTEFKMEEEQLERLLAEEGTSRERQAKERADITRSRQGGPIASKSSADLDRRSTR